MNTRLLFLFVFLFHLLPTTNAQSDQEGGYSYHPRPRPQRQQRPKEEMPSSPSGYVAVNTGVGIPVGNFATNFGTGYGNYALPGSLESITACIPINHKNLGVALMIGLHDNAYDINSFVGNVELTDPNLNKSYGPIHVDDYEATSVMAGGFYTIPVKRFSFDFRLMGGLLFVYMPEVTYGAMIPETFTTAEQDFTWDIQSSSSLAFAIDAGAGVRFALRRHLCLMANLDFMHANVHYATTQQYTDPNGNITVTPMSGIAPLSLVNISFGLGYEFGR